MNAAVTIWNLVSFVLFNTCSADNSLPTSLGDFHAFGIAYSLHFHWIPKLLLTCKLTVRLQIDNYQLSICSLIFPFKGKIKPHIAVCNFVLKNNSMSMAVWLVVFNGLLNFILPLLVLLVTRHSWGGPCNIFQLYALSRLHFVEWH